MAVLPIITGADHPVLRRKATLVKKVTRETIDLLKDMEATTIAAKGAGIAAPQVGRSERLCIALINGELTPLINPVIRWKSQATNTAEEGCLSLPGVWLDIERSTDILLEYTDKKNKDLEVRLHGFDARVVQHEVDHLDGILIVDYMMKESPNHTRAAK